MRKVAFVIPQFPVLSETFVSTEIRAIAAQGHEVQPIAFVRPDSLYQHQDETLKKQTLYLSEHPKSDALKALQYIDSNALQGLKFTFKQQGLSWMSLLGNALKLAYLVRSTGCDHLHAHFAQGSAATAIVAAKLCGATVSFVGHGYDIYATPEDLPLKLNTADFAVAVCEDMCHYFKSISLNVNIALIYCGIEMERFNQAQRKCQLPETASVGDDTGNVVARPANYPKRLLFIGRLCQTKGLFTLFRALNMISVNLRPQVDIVGDGELKWQLTEFADQHGLNQDIHFLGAKQSSWLIENSHHYDALIAPFEQAKNGDRDTGPVVVKEAMAMRLPVITTYFMGCKEMLTDTCALRVPPNDPVALAQMINHFSLLDEKEIETMADNAYLRVMSLFSADLQASYLSQMIEQTH